MKGLSNAGLTAKVRRTISPKRGFGGTLDELQTEFEQDEGDWEPLDFSVTFNGADLLSLVFVQTVTEAYPVSTNTIVTVDLRTGEPLKLADVLTPAGTRSVLERLNRELREAVKDSIRLMRTEDSGGSPSDPELLAQMRAARFSKADLQRSLSLTNTGLGFNHPIDLPHAFQAYEPRCDFEIPWKELSEQLTTPFAERIRAIMPP